MRTLSAVALVLAGCLALPGVADARKAARGYDYQPYPYQPRYYQPRRYYPQPRYYSREQAVCEERAQAADPAGVYAGYPCWAREAFGRTPGGRGR